MGVSIKIVNKEVDVNNNEYQAALALKSMLENSFAEKNNGTIHISYGLTLCGQEVRDIDLLVFGKLDNYILSSYYTNDARYKKKDLKVDGFCVVIELKEHSSDRIDYSNTHIYVEYNGSWKDATDQNEKQRYACASYLENELGYKVYTTNFLWLKSLTGNQLSSLTQGNKIGALPSCFTFKNIIDVLISQGLTPNYNQLDQCYHINSCNNLNFVDDIKKNLFTSKSPINGLTKRKLETLLQKRVNQQLDQERVGENLTIFKGRAGTGKTFRLIQTALKLANPDTGKRCLLLTYNHALVSDIRRLLHFLEIPDGIDTYTVQIQTLHSFFINLMKTLDIDTTRITQNQFNDKEYCKGLNDLMLYVNELMKEGDIKALKDNNKLAIDWDYILIDEAQDWSVCEKTVLFKIYGEKRIIVADGVDQFMRENPYLHWAQGADSPQTIKLETGMRQKTNLVNFVNAFASKLGLNWRVKSTPIEHLAGGRVIILNNYDSTTHGHLLDDCRKAGGDGYDLLFLVPYQMSPHNTRSTKEIQPISIEKWQNVGISLFDGTDTHREQYPTKTDECRLYQYDSCRGLEGWATICFKFDILIENKLKLAKHLQFPERLDLCNREELEKEYAYLWSLMPLTRAIDTLVITLHNTNSFVGRIIKEMAEGDFKDIICWKCNN